MKKYLIIALTLLLLIPEGCKKYDEGPFISLLSKKSRVVGEWYVKEFIVNNVDFLNEYYNYFRKIRFARNTDVAVYILSSKYLQNSLFGKWEFTDNYNNLKISLRDSLYTNELYSNVSMMPFGLGKITNWQIKRLKAKSMILETDYEGNHYFINLVQ